MSISPLTNGGISPLGGGAPLPDPPVRRLNADRTDSVELQVGRACKVQHADMDGLAPTTATCKLLHADGSLVCTPTVTRSTFQTTVLPGSTNEEIRVVDPSGLRVDEPVVLFIGGERVVLVPAVVMPYGFQPIGGVQGAVPSGTKVKSLAMFVTVPSQPIEALGDNLQLVFDYNDGTHDGTAVFDVQVVRWQWQPVMTAADVQTLLSTTYKATRAIEFCRMVAERVDDKIRGAVEQTGRRPYLYISSRSFAEVAQTAARWVLADMGIGATHDVANLIREYRFAFGDEISRILAGMKGYDANNDGMLKPNERRNTLSIRMVR